MKNQKIVSLRGYLDVQRAKKAESVYLQRILKMDKLELLEEMIQFQDLRNEEKSLSPNLIIRGQILFNALEEVAETHELKSLTRDYKKHLDQELKNYQHKLV